MTPWRMLALTHPPRRWCSSRPWSGCRLLPIRGHSTVPALRLHESARMGSDRSALWRGFVLCAKGFSGPVLLFWASQTWDTRQLEPFYRCAERWADRKADASLGYEVLELLRKLVVSMCSAMGLPMITASRLASCSGGDLKQNYTGVFDGGVGFGTRPAVIVVDFVNAYVTPGSPLYCPDPEVGVVAAVRESVDLLRAARGKKVPVIYTIIQYNEQGTDGGMWLKKIPLLRTFTEGNTMTEIVPELAPEAGDTVLVKKYPSVFFGTPLASMLTAMGIDTVILIGCSTSGCVRASACDAVCYGFRVVVPEQCVGDRHSQVHKANLFDINAKLGDVVTKRTVMQYLEGL